ncbi:MAG: ABC transporter ATP-binding protein [Actinomycetota bacterium]
MSSHSHYWRIWRQGDLDIDVPLPKGLVRRILKFAKPYRGRIRLLMVGIVVSSAVGKLTPLVVKQIIDGPLKGRTLNFLNIVPLTLNVLAGALVAVALLGALIGLWQRLLTAKIAEGLIFDLRVGLFDHIQRMPVQFFTRTQTGALVSRLSNDVVGAQRAVSETATSILQIVIDLALTLGLMLALEWRLTLLVLAVFPLFLLPQRWAGKLLEKTVRRQMQTNASMNSRMTERFQVGGALLVKLFGHFHNEKSEFSTKAAEVRDLGIRTTLYSRLFSVSFSLVAALGAALVYWYGGGLVIDGRVELGTIVAFSLLLSQLYGPLRGLSDIPVDAKTALVSFDRVFEVLDFPIGIEERTDAIALKDPKGRIEFKKVCFAYPGSEVSIPSLEEGAFEPPADGNAWVLQDVSFEVLPGKMVALVGPSGAGKTTISMLVPRLYDATEGAVLLDGHDVKDLTVQSLSDAVGIVTQDPHLFHDTIRANLLYAKPDASEAELIEATEAAQIYDLIAVLPDGFDTMVGERGYRLSGGEKQRLAIARLLLKDPAVMILDEATAHLDSESELLIQQAFARALAGRSSLVIAHRLSTIVNADEILVVAHGRIVERGRHFDLLSAGGLYEDLYRTQFERADLDTFAAPALDPDKLGSA